MQYARTLGLGVLGALLLVLLVGWPRAHAATCNPISLAGPDPTTGAVTVSSASALGTLRIYHAREGNDNARIILQGQSQPTPYPTTGPSLNITVPATSYTFRLTVTTPGLATTVDLRIEDGCGAWDTFVGAGAVASAGFPTAQPFPTSTATPLIIPPPPTKQAWATPIPTMTLPQLRLSTNYVLAGDVLEVGWTGISGANQYDWLRFTTSTGADTANTIVYTSTCKDPGTVPTVPARGTGSCLYKVRADTAPGQYQVKLYKYGQANPAAVSTLFSVVSGGSQNDGGKLMTVRSAVEQSDLAGNPDPGLGGYVGAGAHLKPNFAEQTPNYTYSMVGAANRFHPFNPALENESTMLWFPGGWSEAGFLRWCPPSLGPYLCDWHPYGSWGDRWGNATQYVLNGTNSRTAWYASYWRYYEFENVALGGGYWTQDFCGGDDLAFPGCCPMWPEAPICGPDPNPTKRPPHLDLDGMKFLFFGQETPSPNIAAGFSILKDVRYCCRQWPTWDYWGCRPWFGIDWFESSQLGIPKAVDTNRSCSPPTEPNSYLPEWIIHSWRK